jgi:uncharacterized OB-fold protein
MEAREHNGTSFYAYLEDNRLMGSRCGSCRALHVPPRPLCPTCYGDEMSWEEMSGTGELVAFTTVHIGPTAMIAAGYDRHNPYCAGIVRLSEGPTVSGQIIGVDPSDPESIAIGTRLRATYVKRGYDTGTFLAFEPLD